MRVFIDADACPVVSIVENISKKYNIPVTLLCDTNHVLTSEYSEVIVVGAGADAVDYKLISICHKGDIVVSQDYGFDIEIDDFGSGYSSLNMLKDISADVLKIDMGFLRASENEVKGQDILESIIELANKLGMKVITEGVEKKSQLDMLSMMGCKMFQGYYFSKPIPVDEFEEKYKLGQE